MKKPLLPLLTPRQHELLSLLVRLPLGALFVVAGALKLADPTQFAIDVSNYRLFPELAPYLGVLLPYVEVGCGLALFGLPRRWRQASALVLLGLMVVFTIAVVSALARHLNVDCGCFAKGSGPVTLLTALRDLGLVALAALAVWLEGEPSTTPDDGQSTRGPAARTGASTPLS